jgi:formylglycine-generating enzyme required for sulfatase activity
LAALPLAGAPAPPDEQITNTLGMKLKLVKPGKFLMGSPKDEAGRDDDEGPRHEVEITRPFYLGVCPVTKGQFAAFVKEADYRTEEEKAGREDTWRRPPFDQTDDDPVVCVTWNDALRFCDWLGRKEKRAHGLPT